MKDNDFQYPVFFKILDKVKLSKNGQRISLNLKKIKRENLDENGIKHA